MSSRSTAAILRAVEGTDADLEVMMDRPLRDGMLRRYD